MWIPLPPEKEEPKELSECPDCKGTGKLLLFQFYTICSSCHGTGKQQPETD